MVICKICGCTFKNINGLAKHITSKHKNYSKEEYYLKFIAEEYPICKCGKKKNFRDLGVGYMKYCSPKCRSRYIEPTKYWLGKIQPQSLIDKRRETMIERYGVANGFLTSHSVAETYKGFTCRSQWEKRFLDFAEKYSYTISVPDKIKYQYKGKSRWYYPDFYIKELDLIVEVKSVWTYNLHKEMNDAKKQFTLCQGYDIIFIDETNGLLDSSLWDDLNEYILSR